MEDEHHERIGSPLSGSYPIVHAKCIIVLLLDVIPAVQTSGIRGHLAQPRPYQVFLRTEEVTESPSDKSVALGHGRCITTLGDRRCITALGDWRRITALWHWGGIAALERGRVIVPLHPSRSTLDGTDESQDCEADDEWLEHRWGNGAMRQGGRKEQQQPVLGICMVSRVQTETG